ncbi:cytochrome P450 [Aspergillus floccosus]
MSLQLLLQAVPTVCLMYSFLRAVWCLYFHPLRHVPGPRSWIAFPILRHISAIRGQLDTDMRQFHARYGDAVRFAPSEVSFITPEAWKAIYSHGHAQLPKVLTSESKGEDIISANDPDHSRHRKALAHAFSARGLQMQEPLLKGYVDKLIERLKGFAESQLPVDMVKWYNLTTFDLIGDLAFGTSFGGLDNSRYHYWVSTIFDFVKITPFLKIKDAYPVIIPLLRAVLPKRLRTARQTQANYSKETVKKRLNNTAAHGRGDFMDSMLRHRGEKDGLSDRELEENASILIIAGSETTATLLSGVTYWLLRSPEALAKVTDEVRSAFPTEASINLQEVGTRLPYMLACLDEAFRKYPPVPSGLQRRVTTPSVISGYNIPPGTAVSVHQSAAYWSSTNFHRPQEFIPERWLQDVKSDPSSPFSADKRDVVQPFSVGPRNCIGRNLAYAEMRLILARVLWNFDLELCEESLSWKYQKSYVLWDKPALMCNIKLQM